MKLTRTEIYGGFYTKDDAIKKFMSSYGYGVYKNNAVYTNGKIYTIQSIKHTVFNGGHLPNDICTVVKLTFESKTY